MIVVSTFKKIFFFSLTPRLNIRTGNSFHWKNILFFSARATPRLPYNQFFFFSLQQRHTHAHARIFFIKTIWIFIKISFLNYRPRTVVNVPRVKFLEQRPNTHARALWGPSHTYGGRNQKWNSTTEKKNFFTYIHKHTSNDANSPSLSLSQDKIFFFPTNFSRKNEKDREVRERERRDI